MRLMFMTKPLFHIPETTLGVAHGPGNTEGPWHFGRRPKLCSRRAEDVKIACTETA